MTSKLLYVNLKSRSFNCTSLNQLTQLFVTRNLHTRMTNVSLCGNLYIKNNLKAFPPKPARNLELNTIRNTSHSQILPQIVQSNAQTTKSRHESAAPELCGTKSPLRLTESQLQLARYHSTQSDQHRQKVVLETSTPKIVIDNLRDLEKVLPNEDIKGKTLDKFDLLKAKIEPYAKLARWDKPIGVYLLYWPCTWSIAMGSLSGTVPLEGSLKIAGLFFIGAVLMRGAGCTINDMWDRDIDAQVERTKDRPLVSGALTHKQALAFLGAQLSLALGVLLQLNCYSVVLGASSMLLVITYPLAKRFTSYPQLFLGATFNWGALLGFAAVRAGLDPAACIPLYAGALAWTVIYDTIYAHQDKLDDARIGMKSTALTFGPHTKPALSAALVISTAALGLSGAAAGMDWPYYAAVGAYGGHAARQIYTLNPDCPTDCAKKFKSNSLVGLIILLGIMAGGYNQYKDNREKHKGKEDMSVLKSCVFG